MTQQMMFGGSWTQQKLHVLSEYLRAYTKIFDSNQRARFFQTTYVDAFAGTGEIPRAALEGLFRDDPEMLKAEEDFRKGSVTRALEVSPPFDHYVFIEKDAAKCAELEALAKTFAGRDAKIIRKDANEALREWCRRLDTKKERAVVFLDPFGTAVEWKTIKALADTHAVDLWILFPYLAINRMLVSNAIPLKRGQNASHVSLVLKNGRADFTLRLPGGRLSKRTIKSSACTKSLIRRSSHNSLSSG